MASDNDTNQKPVKKENDLLYYIMKVNEKLRISCDDDHSPELNKFIHEQLQEMITMNIFRKLTTKPVTVTSDMLSMLEKSLLQEQLDAKEKENKNLKQELARFQSRGAQPNSQQQKMYTTPQMFQHQQREQEQQRQLLQKQMIAAMHKQHHQQHQHLLQLLQVLQQQQFSTPRIPANVVPEESLSGI